jgi:hypothetical protein
MREALFILLVVLILFALTAFRYRRQISSVLGVWRMLKDANRSRQANQMDAGREVPAGPLVNCAKCGTWVPESSAIRFPPKIFYCSRECVEQAVQTN